MVSRLEKTYNTKYKHFEQKHYITCLRICRVLEKIEKEIIEKAEKFGYSCNVTSRELTKAAKTEICHVDDSQCQFIFEHGFIMKFLHRMNFNFETDQTDSPVLTNFNYFGSPMNFHFEPDETNEDGSPMCTYLLTDNQVHDALSKFRISLAKLKSHFYSMAYLDDVALSIYNGNRDKQLQVE